MNFLSALLFFVLFLFSAYADHREETGGEKIRGDAQTSGGMSGVNPPRPCTKIPEGIEAAECSCDLTPPPEFRREPDMSPDGSAVNVAYPMMTAFGTGSNENSAENDARETCIIAIRETLINSGMSVREANQYPHYSSHILACRPYVCNR